MKKTMSAQQVRRAIVDKASASGLDLNEAKNAFIVANFTAQRRQGPLLNAFTDETKAEKYALEMHTGNTEFYVMSANSQYGLRKVVDEEVVLVEGNASGSVA